MRDLTVFPSTFHHFIASGAKPFEMAVFPHWRQGGKQLYFAIMALQQHLGDACRAAEVAVDLEWRMSAEEVGIGTRWMASVKMDGGLEQVPQKPIGMVTVVKSRPEANLPCSRPSCAFIATPMLGLAAGLH